MSKNPTTTTATVTRGQSTRLPITSVKLTLTPVQAQLLSCLVGRLPYNDWTQPIYDALSNVGFSSLNVPRGSVEFSVNQRKLDLPAIQRHVETL